MVDVPLIFSAPMVLGYLAGRKNQTRRLKGLDRINGTPADWRFVQMLAAPTGYFAEMMQISTGEHVFLRSPYGRKGDSLWFRENFAIVPSSAYRHSEGVWQTVNPGDQDMAAIYAAGWDRSIPKWTPSIHMPRWASRICAESKGVSIERLHDLGDDDAVGEGIEPGKNWSTGESGGWTDYSIIHEGPHKGKPHPHHIAPFISPIKSYASLWDRLNFKKMPYDRNPWCWVVRFPYYEEADHG